MTSLGEVETGGSSESFSRLLITQAATPVATTNVVAHEYSSADLHDMLRVFSGWDDDDVRCSARSGTDSPASSDTTTAGAGVLLRRTGWVLR